LVQTSDGGYALAGWTESFAAEKDDFWLVKTDPQGEKEWSRTFGGWDSDAGLSLVQTSDGGFALAGWTHSFGAAGVQAWLVKAKARYEPRYELSTPAEPAKGGSVFLDPPGGVYEGGENVTATASPASGYEFDRWTDDVPPDEENEKSVTITMDSNKELTARFTEAGGGLPLPWIGLGVAVIIGIIIALIVKTRT
ncbi:hypothetical protein AKJ57_05715, partial [candidate division MSBL1 archaeon SCGC-AAA259A05]